MRLRLLSFPLLLAAAAACSADAPAPPVAGPEGLAFEASAKASGVPRDLLVAIAETEGALDMPRLREVEPDAAVPAAGPLQLRRGKLDTLALGAARMGTSELALRKDADLALEAGARVLAELGSRLGARQGDLASWSGALEELGGYADDLHRRAYAHRVLALLARGGRFAGRGGETLTVPAYDFLPAAWLEIDTRLHTLTTAEYAPAEWFPTSCTNKCDPTRNGGTVQYVVVHDTEGGWDASVATLQNDSGKSVQYIVGSDGRVGQFVLESVTAWHTGNRFYNERSVGIEHVGYANKPFPETQYQASAKLTQYLVDKYAVPKDRAHVIGHDQVPNLNVMPAGSAACPDAPKTCETGSQWGGANNHRDPGDWEWCTYMLRFGGACKCNDVTAILNCTADLTKADRCKGGTVEVYACGGGCVVQAAGTDDTCNGSTPLVADTGNTGDAGAPPADDAGATPPPNVLPDSGGVDAASEPGATPGAPPAGCGCRSARADEGGSAGLLFAAALAIRAVRARRAERKRSRRPPPA